VDEIEDGMSASLSRTITAADIVAFAEISGDTNPLHLDEAFAAASRFRGRIAHGMLAASFISAVFGTKLPGPGAIYISQTLRFKAPVRIGDTVVTEVRAQSVDRARSRVVFVTLCSVAGVIVLEGEAELLLPRRARGVDTPCA